MIDLAQAKELVSSWLCNEEKKTGSPIRLIEHEIEEHEWGWVIFWEHSDRTKLQSDQRERAELPFIVDRTNGRVRPVGTYGVTIAVAKLLADRK